MTDNATQSGSILILAVITIVLAIYTSITLRWWMMKKDKLSNDIVKYALFLVAVAVIILAPALFLNYLMNDIKLVKNIGPNGRAIVILAWFVPALVYNVIRRNKLK